VSIFKLSDGGSKAELVIYDIIGENFFGDGITAKRVQEELSLAGDKLSEITTRINSIGGSVQDGTAIYNLLHRHPAKVITKVESMALSAASVVAMAGDEIHMASNALMMIHGAWGLTQGDARDHESMALKLRKMTEAAADVYAARTGKTLAEVMAWMDAETWFTADEAKKEGFCTEILSAKTPSDAQQSGQASAMMLSMFKRPPAALQQAVLGRMSPQQVREVLLETPKRLAPPALLRGLGRLAGERKRTLGDA
jgi:ATP-dependent Clp protease protease subunit